MGDFFTDRTATTEVHFPEDGVTVTLKKYIDGGIQDDVKNQAIRVRVQSRRNGKQQGQSDDEVREASIRAGDLYVIQQMALKVVTPERTYNHPIGMELFRRMKPQAVARLVQEINEHNPLSDADSDMNPGPDETLSEIPA